MSETVQIALKLSADLVGRIDAAAGPGKRSEFIRAAVEAALAPVPPILPGHVELTAEDLRPGPLVSVERPVSSVVKAAIAADAFGKAQRRAAAEDLSASAQRVLDLAKRHPHSERDIIRVLGWPVGEVKRAVQELEAAGLVRWSRGSVEAV